jgi:flagellar biosynthesis/type III secretory pathway protein FliH
VGPVKELRDADEFFFALSTYCNAHPADNAPGKPESPDPPEHECEPDISQAEFDAEMRRAADRNRAESLASEQYQDGHKDGYEKGRAEGLGNHEDELAKAVLEAKHGGFEEGYDARSYEVRRDMRNGLCPLCRNEVKKRCEVCC